MNQTTILKRNGGGRNKCDRPHAGNGHVKTSSAVVVRSEDLILPTYLPAAHDLQVRQQTAALFLKAQAQLGLGEKSQAQSLLKQVLTRDPNHALAADFLGQVQS